MSESYYEVLGVPKDATLEAIKVAFRAIVIANHPDRVGDSPEAQARFQAATKAFYHLSDAERRRVYDIGFRPINSIMDFRRRPAGRNRVEVDSAAARSAPKRGTDCAVVAKVIRGQKLLHVTPPVGEGQNADPILIPLPEDLDTYLVCRLPTLGTPGVNGGETGDLFVCLDVQGDDMSSSQKGS